MSTQSMLALLDSDPAAGLRAAADLRERVVAAVATVLPGQWQVVRDDGTEVFLLVYGTREGDSVSVSPGGDYSAPVAEHIVAEASPAHALAAARHWRGVAERHTKDPAGDCLCCGYDSCWPCLDLREVLADAKAYVGGAS